MRRVEGKAYGSCGGGSLLGIGREGDVETDETLEKRGEFDKNG